MVVIGGGYTGMWTAWHLLDSEPGIRVLLLEGGVCGHGPSGRNGGFCESLWFSAPALRERFGDAAARALLDASSETVSAIGAWCRDNDVDAWFDQSGYLCASTGPAFDGAAPTAVAAAAALGAPEAVAGLHGRARSASGSTRPSSGAACSCPTSPPSSPARLALGLRQRLIERGVRDLRALARAGARVRGGAGCGGTAWRGRETRAGRVRAGAAVLAVGPSARSIAPLRSRLSVTSSHIVLTEPVPDVLEEIGWTGGECITDGRTLLHYFRTTRDGRIVFGWGGGRLAYGARLNGRIEVDPGAAAQAHRRTCCGSSPRSRGARSRTPGAGRSTCRPATSPRSARCPGAPVHYAFGYTGNGVGPTHLAARALASLALDRRDRYTALPIVGSDAGAWVPPEPLAWLGGSVVRQAFLRREEALEHGEQPDLLTRAACAVPRALGIHVAR